MIRNEGSDSMDISLISMAMSQMRVAEQASVSVLKMGMESNEQAMDGITKMLDNMAVDPNLGNNIDVRV